jgi:hypothetical protein
MSFQESIHATNNTNYNTTDNTNYQTTYFTNFAPEINIGDSDNI